ncbi:MAG: ORF6N domain-containing protein [Candidatus Izemoplasmatales bacterium]|nr:ORF6N domain-containing protein [Candidatus Izemoplasmatales bacterium]
MSDELVTIGNHQMKLKVFNNQPVVTFKDIDEVHEKREGSARQNFNSNQRHFIQNEDFFLVKPQDFRMCARHTSGISQEDVNNRGTTFLTETGYLMLVKTFTDDLSWSIQRSLVNNYFRHKKETKDTTNMVSVEYLDQQVQCLRHEFQTGFNSIHNAFVSVQKALPAVDSYLPVSQSKPKEAVSNKVTDPVLNWKHQIYSQANRVLRLYPTMTKNQHVLRAVYTIMRNQYGIVFEEEKREYKEKYNIEHHVPTIDIIADNAKLKSLFESILNDMENSNVMVEQRKQIVNTVVDPITSTINPLIAKRNDKTKGGNNTYRKVYAAMGVVSWEMRRKRYQHVHKLKNIPSKKVLIRNDPKLLKKFVSTVHQMLAE